MIAKKDTLKVTVTIPAYNVSKLIKEAIESVLYQDYDKFELLILDDGSTDNTFDVIKEYKNHPKVRVYRNEENLGVGAARNKLLRLARGEYISPCDADDIMPLGNLKRLSRFLDMHPHIGAVYADILVIERDKKGRVLKPPFIIGRDCNKTWDLLDNVINHAGAMIRKSLIFKVGGYNETVYSIDDWDLWLKLAEITKIQYLPGEIYYIWRRHPKSLTHTDKRRHFDVKRIIKEAVKRRQRFGFKI